MIIVLLKAPIINLWRSIKCFWNLSSSFRRISISCRKMRRSGRQNKKNLYMFLWIKCLIRVFGCAEDMEKDHLFSMWSLMKERSKKRRSAEHLLKNKAMCSWVLTSSSPNSYKIINHRSQQVPLQRHCVISSSLKSPQTLHECTSVLKHFFYKDKPRSSGMDSRTYSVQNIIRWIIGSLSADSCFLCLIL